MRATTLILALSGTLLALWADSDTDSKTVAVLLASPGWRMGDQTISRGKRLSPTATLTLQQADSSDLLLQCPNHNWLSYTCQKYPCRVPVCSTQVEGVTVQRRDKGTEASGLGDRLLALFTREATTPVTLGVRGGGNPNDAVVLLKEGTLHLAPALNRVLEGQYCFSLHPLDPANRQPDVALAMKWDKNEDPEGLIKAPAVVAGAYALKKENGGESGACSPNADAVPAWIVVAPEASFDELNARWKENRAWFEELAHSGASAAVQTTARHAIIADLSASLAR